MDSISFIGGQSATSLIQWGPTVKLSQEGGAHQFGTFGKKKKRKSEKNAR